MFDLLITNGPAAYESKGIGESSNIPVDRVIANAVYDAVGVRIMDSPVLADKVLAGLRLRERLKPNRKSQMSDGSFKLADLAIKTLVIYEFNLLQLRIESVRYSLSRLRFSDEVGECDVELPLFTCRYLQGLPLGVEDGWVHWRVTRCQRTFG